MSLEVGTEGILGGQAVVADVEGTWKVGVGQFIAPTRDLSEPFLLDPNR